MRRLSIIALAAGMIFTQPATTAADPTADGPSAQHAPRRAARRRGATPRRPRRPVRGDRSKVRRGGGAAESRPKPPDPSGQPMEELVPPELYLQGDPRAKRPPARRTRVRKEIPDVSNPSPPRPPFF
ncbi:MAG TPA: hypothetical protein VK421_20830 [Pyrinomonadaceae bacterium]|nr:hypothetical protein [Pyrinomonadaceae bacterium]